jgi:predicted DNA-binding ribbon-helix-helix protein
VFSAASGGYARGVETIPEERDVSSQSESTALLGIYLNDHLAGAVAGSSLARRLAGAERNWTAGDVLQRLADEIDEDRETLLKLMSALDVPVRHYKVLAAAVAERVTRLKPNGQMVGRSPLSRVIELEAMRLGVEGKAAGWRTLRTRAETDARLDAAQIDALISRAQRQIDQLERLRVHAAADAFGGQVDPVEPVADR